MGKQSRKSGWNNKLISGRLPFKASLIRTAAIISLLFATHGSLICAYAANDSDMAPAEITTVAPKPEWEDLGNPDSKENSVAPSKSKFLIKGSVDYLVPKGTPFKLKLAAVPTHGPALKLMDRDLEGKLYPAKVGQEITARTSEDMYVDDNKVIPEGTVFHGVVSEVEPPRRVNRKGWLKISFNSLTTPDGRDFAFDAKADNFQKSTLKSKVKGFGGIAAFSAGGAVVGALVAYQIFGLHETIAMHGYNIAGGAAGGAMLATCYAVMRHGAEAVLEPGDDLNMSIDSDLLMPAAVDATAKRAQVNRKGVEIKILKSKLMKDGLEGKILRLTVDIENATNEPLNSIDLFCEDSNHARLPLVGGADLDESSSFMFTVEPNSKQHMILNFLVEYPKLKRTLVWLDHDSRAVCYRGAIP